MIHVHHLDGCAPTPLAHYLKALGILRLVAEQADENARGWWEGERFRLAAVMTADDLMAFFRDRYAPTPILSPWNKGSGFFAANDPGLQPVETSKAARFSALRAGIKAARTLLVDLEQADRAVRAVKAEAKVKGMTKAQKEALRTSAEYKGRLAEADRSFKKLKADLLPRFRRTWRGPLREWMDAAMVLAEDGSAMFPSLLGTGGNDGRLDFTNNFLQRLGDMFDLGSTDGAATPEAENWLKGSLFGLAVTGCQCGSAVGQYFPGWVGGANNSNGPEAESLLNPWDFLFMLEGSLIFTAYAARRLGVGEQTRAAAPFAVTANGSGYASASGSDESARGEQWMPIWSQPQSLAELKRLLAEGRAQIGAKPAREPLDLARAVARLGTARGIGSFQRYGYIERNGQSNLAVSLGRFTVPDQAPPQLACLDDLDAWLPRLRREARDSHASARLTQVERQLGDALFAVTQHADEAGRWQRVLLALAAVESVQASGSGFGPGPVPTLRPDWVRAADDGSPELRLALALSLQQGDFDGTDVRWWNPIRRHWLPLDPKRPWRFATTGSVGHLRLQVGPEVVGQGRDGVDDAIALIGRRLIEATQHGGRRLPLLPSLRASAYVADLGRLVAGEVDLDRTLGLARAFMALRASDWRRAPQPPGPPAAGEVPDDAWLVLRLALLPWHLKDPYGNEIRITTDPVIFRRLASGDAATAVALALRRLSAAGIRAAVRASALPPQTARLWAAALAFPISPTTAWRFVRRLDPRKED
jgi:CRISPR-associated protein Csx17